MTTETRKKRKVYRKTGYNLASVLANTLAKDYYSVITELVSNSYDEDAHNVHISANVLEDIVQVEDDGQGMDKKGIDSFYRLGDSDKLRNPYTPDGRKRIGRFGIAAVLIEYLGESYTLETWKDGYKIIVRENFKETKKGKAPFFKRTKIKGDKKGTRITIQNLKCTPKTFDLKKLENVLEWKVPSLPDFSTYLNQVLIKKRVGLRYATEYFFEESLKGIGNVHGSIFVTGRRNGSKNSDGIYVYVNNRAVGNPQAFKQSLKGKYKNRVLGIVHADGLIDEIGFDREDFKTDTKAYIALKQFIQKTLNSIMSDDPLSQPRILASIQEQAANKIHKPLANVEERLNRQLLGKGVELPFTLHIEPDPDASWPSMYNPENGLITFNGKHPMVSVQQNKAGKRGSIQEIENIFLFLSLYALGVSTANFSSVIQHELEENIIKYTKSMLPERVSLDQIIRVNNTQNIVPALAPHQVQLHKYRLFTVGDIHVRTGLDLNTIKYLVMTENIIPHKSTSEKFDAHQVSNMLKRVEGLVPAAKIINYSEYMKPMKLRSNADDFSYNCFTPVNLDIYEQKNKPTYLVDLGLKGVPFYFVEHQSIEPFTEWYEQNVD